jgi:hypothetical protein
MKITEDDEGYETPSSQVLRVGKTKKQKPKPKPKPKAKGGVRIHGNYCGPGWTAGMKRSAKDVPIEDYKRVDPTDMLDSACRRHDWECGHVPPTSDCSKEADARLIKSAMSVAKSKKSSMGLRAKALAVAAGMTGAKKFLHKSREDLKKEGGAERKPKKAVKWVKDPVKGRKQPPKADLTDLIRVFMSQNQQVVTGNKAEADEYKFGEQVIAPWLKLKLDATVPPGLDLRTGSDVTMDPYPEGTVQIGTALPDSVFLHRLDPRSMMITRDVTDNLLTTLSKKGQKAFEERLKAYQSSLGGPDDDDAPPPPSLAVPADLASGFSSSMDLFGQRAEVAEPVPQETSDDSLSLSDLATRMERSGFWLEPGLPPVTPWATLGDLATSAEVTQPWIFDEGRKFGVSAETRRQRAIKKEKAEKAEVEAPGGIPLELFTKPSSKKGPPKGPPKGPSKVFIDTEGFPLHGLGALTSKDGATLRGLSTLMASGYVDLK